MLWIVIALQLSTSCKTILCLYIVLLRTSHLKLFYIIITDAQLTSPNEVVCVGGQIVFTCQQTRNTFRWTVNLPNGDLSTSASSSQAGTVLTLSNDPGYGFEIHILSSSSKLRVTAVRQLNGVTVECEGPSGTYMSTIQIALVGESVHDSVIIVVAVYMTRG